MATGTLGCAIAVVERCAYMLRAQTIRRQVAGGQEAPRERLLVAFVVPGSIGAAIWPHGAIGLPLQLLYCPQL